MVEYWELRRKVFKERAYRPLSACGQGVLDDEAITLLQEAIFVQLPNDERGRGVIYVDRARYRSDPSFYSNLVSC